MNLLIILAHPDKGSFNHAIAHTCQQKLVSMGHTVVLHDLYAEGFDPIIISEEIPKHATVDATIQRHCDALTACDALIVVHPNWWGQPPAILKGWIDRVIRPDVAYKFLEGDNGEGIPQGLLKAQIGLVFNTSNTSATREDNVFKDPLDAIWRHCIFDFCGIKTVDRRVFRIVVTSRLEQRLEWLKEVESMMDTYFGKVKPA